MSPKGKRKQNSSGDKDDDRRDDKGKGKGKGKAPATDNWNPKGPPKNDTLANARKNAESRNPPHGTNPNGKKTMLDQTAKSKKQMRAEKRAAKQAAGRSGLAASASGTDDESSSAMTAGEDAGQGESAAEGPAGSELGTEAGPANDTVDESGDTSASDGLRRTEGSGFYRISPTTEKRRLFPRDAFAAARADRARQVRERNSEDGETPAEWLGDRQTDVYGDDYPDERYSFERE